MYSHDIEKVESLRPLPVTMNLLQFLLPENIESETSNKDCSWNSK